jgi:putative transcriptional regulator
VRKPQSGRVAKVRLVSLHPGMIIPHHDHGGAEYTVVFSGGLRDHQGTCHRGDVAVRNPGDRHRQHVETGAQCVALVVNEGDLLPTTWIGRLVKRLARE